MQSALLLDTYQPKRIYKHSRSTHIYALAQRLSIQPRLWVLHRALSLDACVSKRTFQVPKHALARRLSIQPQLWVRNGAFSLDACVSKRMSEVPTRSLVLDACHPKLIYKYRHLAANHGLSCPNTFLLRFILNLRLLSRTVQENCDIHHEHTFKHVLFVDQKKELTKKKIELKL